MKNPFESATNGEVIHGGNAFFVLEGYNHDGEVRYVKIGINPGTTDWYMEGQESIFLADLEGSGNIHADLLDDLKKGKHQNIPMYGLDRSTVEFWKVKQYKFSAVATGGIRHRQDDYLLKQRKGMDKNGS